MHRTRRNRQPGIQEKLGKYRPLLQRIEVLERRELLTTVVVNDRIPRANGVDEFHSWVDLTSVQDSFVDFEISSSGNESMVIDLRSMADISVWEVFDPSGDRSTNWTRTPRDPSTYFSQSMRLMGTTAPGEGMTRLRVKVTKENDNPNSIQLKGWVQLPIYDVKPLMDTHLSLTFQPLVDEQGSQANILALMTTPEQERPSFMDSWTYSTLDANDAVVNLPSGGGEAGELVLQTPEQARMVRSFHWGVWFEYESDTGNLRVRTAEDSPLAALEILSPSRFFEGPEPAIIDENFFNVYFSGKLFVLTLPGSSTLEFGPVLKPGLTRQQLLGDLKITGAFRAGGNLNQIVWSIDGDLPFHEVVDSFETQLQFPHVVAAERQITTPSGNHQLRLRYTWDVQDVTSRPYLTGNEASFGYRATPNNDWRHFSDSLMPCPTTCEMTVDVPVELTAPYWIRLENQSIGSTLQIHSLDLLVAMEPPKLRFELNVEPGEWMSVESSHENSPRLLDLDGNLVTQSAFFQIHGKAAGVDRYILELTITDQPLSLNVTRRPDTTFNQYPLTVDSSTSDQSVQLSWSEPIDTRTCTLEDFSWDGPPLIAFRMNGDRATLEYGTALENRNYTMTIQDGRCVSLSGRLFDSNTLTIDHIRPEIRRLSLQDASWLPTGSGFVVLEFSEPLGSWGNQQSAIATLTWLDKQRQRSVSNDNVMFFVNNGLLVRLPELQAGTYELQWKGLTVFDQNGNTLELSDDPIRFSVSDTPVGVERSPWDVDLDGVVNLEDLQLLNYLTWSDEFRSHWFDLNHDGLMDVGDVDAWIHEQKLNPYGDTNLDGVFDSADLDYLSYLPLGSEATWMSGDFDGDGFYTSADLVLAMQGGLVSSEKVESDI